MQTHAEKGAEYLQGIPELAPIIPIVRSHHERWDGTGYPDRIAKEDIPLLARIVAVADAFDAMTSNRPYHVNKKGRPASEAFAEVERQAGRQFDPKVAEAFLSIQDEVINSMEELMDDTGTQFPRIRSALPSELVRRVDRAVASPAPSESDMPARK
jgi:HD-GYP domain-containing protein (c-di-GMP phosphodiesterase class II)